MFADLIQPSRPGGVGVAFTDRWGGCSTGEMASLNLGRTDLDSVVALRANLAGVRAALGVEPVVVARQVHGTDVLIVDAAFLASWGPDGWLGDAVPGQARLPVADALVTTLPGVALAVRVADCVPVVLADESAGVVGVAHAGRVGLLAGVVPAAVAALCRAGAVPERLRAWIGPHACPACYEVPAEMAAEAEAILPGVAARTSRGTPSLDLGAGVARQLADVGVARVERAGPCTITTPSLFSHRRQGPGAGRQLALVWLAP